MQQQPPSGALSDFRDWMSQLLREDDDDDYQIIPSLVLVLVLPFLKSLLYLSCMNKRLCW